ncbi:FOXH1 protein, partial [Alcedo cyanopectus]|nr:FOXH1 protein [Ceyx cyanopectus]
SVSRSGPGSGRASRGGSRPPPQRYRRHPKPPYSYLALIALVIRAAPGQRLKLAQIIQELSSLFPFFGGGYQGWKDSVRHNLSCNPCFAKVLKDPAKPKAKGNYWTVDLSRIPPGALRLQNTAVARGTTTRGGGVAFARDLTPFILQGCPYPPPPQKSPPPTPPPASPPSPPPAPFSIASLLREFPEGGAGGGKSGTPPAGKSGPPPTHPAVNIWGSAPLLHLATPPPSWGPPIMGRGSGGAVVSASPPSSAPQGGPSAPASVWGQLPTSYSTAVAPNAVAPSSHPGGPPFLALPWGVLTPTTAPPPPPQPPGSASAPGALEMGGSSPQTVPPNKSIFDVWLSHPGDIVPP